MKKWGLVISIIAIFSIGTPWFRHISTVHAQSQPMTTQVGYITGLGTGWYNNVMFITTSAPYLDNGCSGQATQQYATLDGYVANPVTHSALLGALLSGKRVSVTVQGCAYGHPQIIGVSVLP